MWINPSTWESFPIRSEYPKRHPHEKKEIYGMVGYGAKRNKPTLSRRIYRAINCKVVLRCSQLARESSELQLAPKSTSELTPRPPQQSRTWDRTHCVRSQVIIFALTAYRKVISPLHAPHHVTCSPRRDQLHERG